MLTMSRKAWHLQPTFIGHGPRPNALGAEVGRGPRHDMWCGHLWCVPRAAWNTPLAPRSHGCSKCKEVFADKAWSVAVVQHHKHSRTDLVCAVCRDHGYAPGEYDSHQCRACSNWCGPHKFEKHNLQNAQRQQGSTLICKDCRSKLRCAACNVAYDNNYWSKSERDHHKSKQGTPLVCKACRAFGYRPSDLGVYECRRCKRKLGSNRFDKHMLENNKYR